MKWQRVYRVIPEGTEVIECRARYARDGLWTVEQVGGHRREQHDHFWFERFFADTPEAAIEKFLARQVQRLARLRYDRAEIKQQQQNARELRARWHQKETAH